MPGVIIRLGGLLAPEVVKFSKNWLWANGYLEHQGQFTNLQPYVTHGPGFVESVIVRVTTPVTQLVTIYIDKNGAPFLDIELQPGDSGNQEQYDSTDHPFGSLDSLSCRISGGDVNNISVQMRII